MRKKKASTTKKKDITLRDVIIHAQGVEKRLTNSLKDVEQRLTTNINDVEQRLTTNINDVEQRLTTNINDVEQRLTSNIMEVASDAKDMEQRLSSKIDANTRGITGNTLAIKDLSLRIDALEEDLVATMKDTLTIRSHVGMATSEE